MGGCAQLRTHPLNKNHSLEEQGVVKISDLILPIFPNLTLLYPVGCKDWIGMHTPIIILSVTMTPVGIVRAMGYQLDRRTTLVRALQQIGEMVFRS